MFEKLKNGLKVVTAPFVDAAPGEAGDLYEAGGIPIKCPHCQGTKFLASRVLLNTFGAALIGMDWVNSEATVLTCSRCSRLQWFADELDPKE